VRGRGREGRVATPTTSRVDARRGVPPGQRPASHWGLVHYGRIPRQRSPDWEIHVTGATASGHDHVLDLTELTAFPRRAVLGDLHCVSGFSVLDLAWEGTPASRLLELVRPRDDVRYVMAWAEYGYSANLSLDDFAADATILATHANGEPLEPERGGPVRLVVPHLYAWKGPKWLRAVEYLTEDRRGFWEERGYHNGADPWAEQRYSYQEDPGAGPPL
jgi:DMSO/TMAO reductase YedYZ molybdopterin-dependent catalytic subunit